MLSSEEIENFRSELKYVDIYLYILYHYRQDCTCIFTIYTVQSEYILESYKNINGLYIPVYTVAENNTILYILFGKTCS